MSEEERELLDRISALAGKPSYTSQKTKEESPPGSTNWAGQINRHKNQQAGFQPSQSSRSLRRTSTAAFLPDFWYSSILTEQNARYRGSSYRGRGYRIAHPPVHRHRTLNLNAHASSSESSPSTPVSASDNAQWVSKTDRHKQLINANIYQQQAQSRAQAIEETRKRKLTRQQNSERARFNKFLQQSQGSSVQNHEQPEIMIDSIRFLVRDGGKKLVRAAGKSKRPFES